MNALCSIKASLPRRKVGSLSLYHDHCTFCLNGVSEQLQWSRVSELTVRIVPTSRHLFSSHHKRVQVTLSVLQRSITVHASAAHADALLNCVNTLKAIEASYDQRLTQLSSKVDSLSAALSRMHQEHAQHLHCVVANARTAFQQKFTMETQLVRDSYAERLAQAKNNITQLLAENKRLQDELSRLTLQLRTPESSPLDPSPLPVIDTPKYQTDNGFALSPEQARAYDILNTSSENIFITGKAGTGKSVLLRYFAAHTGKCIALLAPTGLAAINISGETIHRFFGLPPAAQTHLAPSEIKISDEKKRIMKRLDAIVIDEISMVRSDVMDAVDMYLRVGRNKLKQPFGGCQIIVFGDLFQLPPVPEKDKVAQQYLLDTYKTLFFFGAPAVRDHPFRVFDLQIVHRQQDSTFIALLNRIRTGNVTDQDIEHLNQQGATSASSSSSIILTPHRQTARDINTHNLGMIAEEEFVYEAEASGDFLDSRGHIIEDDAPADTHLRLKKGARVMLLRNDPANHWVNGTLASIGEISQDCIHVIIDKVSYPLSRCQWEKYRYTYNVDTKQITREKSGTFAQFPIRLAYAITIHKSQGQTYDDAIIDYSNNKRAFTSGQTYVAISRCRSLAGLHLRAPLSRRDIITNPEVLEWFRSVHPQTL